MDMENIKQELEKKVKHSTIKLQEDMKKHTSFKIGGNADMFIQANSQEDIGSIVQYAKQKNIPITVIGNGSNVLVKDKGIRGITLCITLSNFLIRPCGNDKMEIEAEARRKTRNFRRRIAWARNNRF